MAVSTDNMSGAPVRFTLDDLPPVDLRHLLVLTDDTGLLQHAVWSVPDHRHGYCTDDNSRALLAALIDEHVRDGHVPRLPLRRYLAFVHYAFDPRHGRFRNFMGYDRRWLEDVGSEDSHARALWALGAAVRLAPDGSIGGLAADLFARALPAVLHFGHLRSVAGALLALDLYLAARPGDARADAAHARLAAAFFERWQRHSSRDWPWWEDSVTWGNARLPHALLVAGARLGRDDILSAGLGALQWLLDVQTRADGQLSLIGNDGWFVRGGVPARFDQQPIEAQVLVQACLAAADATGAPHWIEQALRCFAWFHGRNVLALSLHDPDTGGCKDGLQLDRVNANQGAESTLAWVLSLLELRWYRARNGAGA